MLGKLIKHELRATGRLLLPSMAVLLVLAVLAGLSMRRLEFGSTVPEFVEILLVLIFVAFFIGIAAICVMTLWLMISRFYKNLLGDEGYLMFTLPVSVHSHIWAKLIVSLIWFLVVGLVVALLVFGLIVSLTVSDFGQFMEGFPSFRELFRNIRAAFRYDNGKMILFFLEFCLLAFAGAVNACLQFYAAMAIGHSFANHKLLFSVLAFVIISFVLSILRTAAGGLIDLSVYVDNVVDFMSYIMHPSLIFALLQSILLYCISVFFLKRRLNLA